MDTTRAEATHGTKKKAAQATQAKPAKKRKRKRKRRMKLWAEATGSIQDWVKNTNCNKITNDDMLQVVNEIPLRRMRSLYRQIRHLVQTHGYQYTATVYAPEINMTFGQMACLLTLKKTLKI